MALGGRCRIRHQASDSASDAATHEKGIRALRGLARLTGGRARLYDRLTRYEGQIVADLAEQGWDTYSLFRARRYRFLLTLIDELPSTSRTVAAILNDPEVALETARALAEAEDDDSTEAQLRAQTPEVRVMQDIFDLLVSAFGGKETYPRPESLTAIALEDARTSVRDRSAHQALAALMPGWSPQET